MLAASLAQSAPVFQDPWRFQPHPEVWLLVAFLIGAYVYMVRVIGPHAVPVGVAPVSRRNVTCFVGAMALLWLASDWPMHDIAEEYLYSAHMLQHMALSYFMPPLVLLATPEWLLRTLVGEGRGYQVYRWFAHPVVAGVLFNLMVMVTHIPGVVNASGGNPILHYSVHVGVVVTAIVMWTPVVGPFRELRIATNPAMIYLFLQSIVPTVPAGWLTFAEGIVYKHYDIPVRVWGVSATDDQQMAGAIMKLGGSMFLWTIVVYLFITRFNRQFHREQTYRRSARMPDVEVVDNEDFPLTYDAVQREFARTAAPDPDGPTPSGTSERPEQA